MPNKNVSIFNLLILFLIVGASITFSIYNIVSYGKLMRRNKDLRDYIEVFRTLNMKSENEVNQLGSVERIRKVASEKLGMSRIDSAIERSKIIVLEKSKIK